MPTAASNDAQEASPGYLWQVPGKPVAVKLSDRVARTILKSGKHRFGRTETGGVLLGRVASGPDGILVNVEESVEVPCEHLFGPHYSLSEGDKELCQEILDESTREGVPLRPVGFYRSHARKGLHLDGEDLELMQEFFPGPDCVALVVKRHWLGASRAGFFIREEERIRPEASYLELALRPGRAPKLAAASGHRTPLWCSWWLQAPLLVGLLAADGLFGYASARRWTQHKEAAAPPRDPYRLSLLVLEYADNLHLSWDRQARPIEKSASGLLHIIDGGQTRTVNLSSDQMRSGSVVYRRMSPQVRFRLEVLLNPGRSVSETWDSTLARDATR